MGSAEIGDVFANSRQLLSPSLYTTIHWPLAQFIQSMPRTSQYVPSSTGEGRLQPVERGLFSLNTSSTLTHAIRRCPQPPSCLPKVPSGGPNVFDLSQAV